MFSHRIQVKQNRYEMMKSGKDKEFRQFCENWYICIASTPPKNIGGDNNAIYRSKRN
jgi:hypothetical protein